MRPMIILPFIGVALIAIGAGISCRQYTKIQGKEVSEGKVVALEPHRGSKGGTVYTIVAEFRDSAGNPHAYRSKFNSSNPGYGVGEKIRIFFDRGNPSDCGIMSFGYRFGVGWCLIVAGLALLLIQLGWSWGSQWMNDNFPTTIRHL